MAVQGAWAGLSVPQRWGLMLLALFVLADVLLVAMVLRRGGDDAAGGTDSALVTSLAGVAPARQTSTPTDGETVTADDTDAAVRTASPVDADDHERLGCPVAVWTTPHLQPAVQAAAERASEGCYTVTAHADVSAQAALRGGERPDVWIPGSDAWPALVTRDGVGLEVGETIASSPVLLAGTPPAIGALEQMGVGAETSWSELVEQVVSQRAAGESLPFVMRAGDPRSDAATMALLTTTGSRPGGWAEPDSAQRGMLVLLAHTAVVDDPLTALVAEPTTIVPATEQQVGAARAGGLEVSALALEEGLGRVQAPFVRVGEGSPAGVDALEDELTSPDAAEDLRASWWRAGTTGEAPDAPGVPEEVPATHDLADPATVPVTAETWAAISRQSRILTAIDISLSMEEQAGDSTRVDLTREAAQTALQTIPPRTAVGVWYFATGLEGTQDWTEVVPLRPLGERVEDGTHLDVLMSVTGDLDVATLEGDTGLHDTLWAAYQKMQEEWTPEAVNSVLLLTDGKNNDTTGGLSEDEVVDLLSTAHAAGDRPVTVVLIGMGPDVNEAALDRLASAAGGVSVVIRDPRELPQVFVEVVAQRTG